MNAEIVMIGTELLLGQIVDTNATHIARVLAENGINLFQKTTVGDNRDRILRVLDAALDRADVVLVSGGLGPTEDDITRDCVAELTGRPLEFRQELMDQLEERFRRIGRPISENNKRQAYAPRGATALPNPNGTAPGVLVEDPRGVIVCMPGVPFELYAMLGDSVLPYLRDRFGLAGVVHYRVLKLCGIGESRVDEAIADLILAYDNPKIGLLASPDAVRIRISARAEDVALADALIDEADRAVRQRLPGLIAAVDDDTLERVVDRLLAERGLRFAVHETHTGGMLGQRLTAAGAAQFAGATVLPLRPTDDLARRAAEAAGAVRIRFEVDCGLAIVADADSRTVAVHWVAPEDAAGWTMRYAQLDELHQLRGAVMALEYVRRRLLGVADDVLDARN